MTMQSAARILVVAGARPNFVKVAPIIDELRAMRGIRPVFVHTGQHYDFQMSEAFFQDLALPTPDHYLNVGSGTHAEQTARVMLAFEPVLLSEKPDIMVVVGDVNSTLACAVTAAKLGVAVAHVEAGLRSFDATMPEEINRRLTDAISDYLFTPSQDGDENLLREGVAPERIHFVGNVMIDTLRRHESAARAKKVYERYGLEAGRYAVLTLHRPANVDDPDVLGGMLAALAPVATRMPILFPAHPRTQQRLGLAAVADVVGGMPGLRVCDPLGYLDFLGILAQARLVLTDSGGIQEETTALGVRCLTLRNNTERPITVTRGTNTIAGTDPARIAEAAVVALDAPMPATEGPPLWDGRTAGRIARILARAVEKPR
jgi:UDP-N-acetylglucosamine 2-epimerase (non-hydrolysing)